MFLGMSVAGTLFHGYFFAFHLLNVVNNNQLLSGVIKAVTLNGETPATRPVGRNCSVQFSLRFKMVSVLSLKC